MRTFEKFIQLDERAFSQRGQAARAKMRNQNAQNLANKINPRTGTPMKALPAGRSSAPKTPTQAAVGNKPSRGGALAVMPTNKASSIVRHKMQDAKDRESNKSQAKQKLNSGSGGTPILGTRKPRQPSADARKSAADKLKASKEHDSKAGDRLNKRRGGMMGGIKKALGGDVIGVRAKSGDTEADKEVRKDANSKARADFAQKKVGQAGNAVKGAGNSAKNFVKNALKNNVKDVDSVEGKEGSSAGRMQKQY